MPKAGNWVKARPNNRTMDKGGLTMDTPKAHQLRIARDSMKYSCFGVRMIGGPDHQEARAIIRTLTGFEPVLPENCTCLPGRA